MVKYMKCPRCELNYIDAEKQEYCDVCLKEMKGIVLDEDLENDPDDDIPTELCPVCGENMMRPGEKMCEECRKKSEYEEEETDDEEDDEWRNYLDDDTDIPLDEDIGEIDETFDDDLDEEEEEEFEEAEEEEDLDYVTGDEIYRLTDDDDDEEDEEDFGKSDGDDF